MTGSCRTRVAMLAARKVYIRVAATGLYSYLTQRFLANDINIGFASLLE